MFLVERLLFTAAGLVGSVILLFLGRHLAKTDTNLELYHTLDKRLALLELAVKMVKDRLGEQKQILTKIQIDINEAFARLRNHRPPAPPPPTARS